MAKRQGNEKEKKDHTILKEESLDNLRPFIPSTHGRLQNKCLGEDKMEQTESNTRRKENGKNISISVPQQPRLFCQDTGPRAVLSPRWAGVLKIEELKL